MAGKIEKAVFTTVEVCEAGVVLFKCQEGTRKQFSPLLRSCEARAGQFRRQENLESSF